MLFWTCDIILSIVTIILIFAFMKYWDDDSISSGAYFGCILLMLIPLINMIVCFVIFLFLLVFGITEGINRFRKYNKIKQRSKREIQEQRINNLPQALIDAGYFSNLKGIHDFMDGYLLSKKLINDFTKDE